MQIRAKCHVSPNILPTLISSANPIFGHFSNSGARNWVRRVQISRKAPDLDCYDPKKLYRQSPFYFSKFWNVAKLQKLIFVSFPTLSPIKSRALCAKKKNTTNPPNMIMFLNSQRRDEQSLAIELLRSARTRFPAKWTTGVFWIISKPPDAQSAGGFWSYAYILCFFIYHFPNLFYFAREILDLHNLHRI